MKKELELRDSLKLHFKIEDMTDSLKFIECNIDTNDLHSIEILERINNNISALVKNLK